MIRRDFILRMIEEFAQALARVNSFKRDGAGAKRRRPLTPSSNDSLARAPKPSHVSRNRMFAVCCRTTHTRAADKTLILTALLNEAGDVAAAQGRTEESRVCYLKALHLCSMSWRAARYSNLRVCPEVEMLESALEGSQLSCRPCAADAAPERTGEFAKAEDELFACSMPSRTTNKS